MGTRDFVMLYGCHSSEWTEDFGKLIPKTYIDETARIEAIEKRLDMLESAVKEQTDLITKLNQLFTQTTTTVISEKSMKIFRKLLRKTKI